MRFSVLGPLEVAKRTGESQRIGSGKQRALLAMLLSRSGGVAPVDELIDGLWGVDPPPSAERSLRVYVSRLRKLVGEELVRHDDGYALNCAPEDVDVWDFENDVANGRYTTALQRVRGRPYGEFSDLPPVRAEARRLESLIATARAGRIEEWFDAGHLAETVAGAEAMLADEPLDERVWTLLVRALGRSGRVADALRAFQRGADELAEAGLEPGSELREAEQEVLAHRPSEPAEAAPRRRVPPEPLTTSIGREMEIDRVIELTGQRRLTTIVGPGGVGKTRLALEVGRRVAGRHRLGARLVELSRISSPDAIRPAVRRALDLPEGDSELLDELGALDALLILDNCEHVIDAATNQVSSLLGGGDSLRILTTSREPLSIPGEQRWVLPPLSTAGPNAPAMTLFVERARDVGVEVDPEDPNAERVVTCLDGLPLTIEMAAARLGTMGLADLADQLGETVLSLADPRRGDRHATLRAVLAWSEELLTPDLRSALADFSVFAGAVGTADLPAALEADDPVETVTALAARSLVIVDTAADGRARYRSLETIRQFGRERLDAAGRYDAAARRHAEWFTHAAEKAAVIFDSPAEADAVARLDAILDELREAHRWSRANDPALGLRMSRALFLWAYQGVRLEVFDWGLALADIIGPDAPDAVPLLGELSAGLVLRGQFDAAAALAELAITNASEPSQRRTAHLTLADVALYRGELDESAAHARTNWELLGSTTSIEWGLGLANLSVALAYHGQIDEALELLSSEPHSGAAPTTHGWIAYSRGETLLDADPQEALRHLDTATAIAESVSNQFLAEVARVSAASLRARVGSPEDAIVPLAGTIYRLAETGNVTHLVTTLRNLPTLLVRLEAWEPAAEVIGGLSANSISPTFGNEADRLAAAEAAVRAALGDEAFTAAARRGAGRTILQVAAVAVTELEQLRLDL